MLFVSVFDRNFGSLCKGKVITVQDKIDAGQFPDQPQSIDDVIDGETFQALINSKKYVEHSESVVGGKSVRDGKVMFNFIMKTGLASTVSLYYIVSTRMTCGKCGWERNVLYGVGCPACEN